MTRVLIAVVALAAGGCSRHTEPAYTFTELSFPGSTATVASGINDAGHIVGTYWQEARASGFIYRDGVYTSIRYPNALQTQLHGISEEGDIVGSYGVNDGESGMGFNGFVMTRSGDFRDLRHPDFRYGMAMGIADDGTVVGCYHNEDGVPGMRGMMIPAHAFTETGVTLEAVDILDRRASMHNGTAPDGRRIVGMISDIGRGYLMEGGALTHIDVPEARRTEAWGVSSSGAVVGVWVDAASVRHGFLLEKERFTTIDVPDAAGTSAFGINARGDIVGGFRTAAEQSRPSGLIDTPDAPAPAWSVPIAAGGDARRSITVTRSSGTVCAGLAGSIFVAAVTRAIDSSGASATLSGGPTIEAGICSSPITFGGETPRSRIVTVSGGAFGTTVVTPSTSVTLFSLADTAICAAESAANRRTSRPAAGRGERVGACGRLPVTTGKSTRETGDVLRTPRRACARAEG